MNAESSAGRLPGLRLICLAVRMEDAGQRVDQYLSLRCEDLSRSHFKRLVQDGAVLVNDREVKPSYEVRPEDRITVRMPDAAAEDGIVPQPMPLDILYEDDHIVVVNKAPGVVVHPGAGHEEGTLVHGLLARYPRLAMQGAPRRPGIVHRLDRDTSGALVVARSERAYLDLIEQFKEHHVRKEYLALAYGRFSQSEGEIRTFLDRHSEDRKKIAVVQGRGREAISLWRVKEELGGEVTLLRVEIETGRTHQIRVHLSFLKHPVVGDETYGGGRRRSKVIKSRPLRQILERVERQMLHARHLEFCHPVSKETISITAPLPSDFADLIEQIRHL